LQEFIGILDTIKDLTQIIEGLLVVDGTQGRERISFAGVVGLGLQEAIDEIGCIRNEVLGVLVNALDGKDGILSNVSMAMFETSSC